MLSTHPQLWERCPELVDKWSDMMTTGEDGKITVPDDVRQVMMLPYILHPKSRGYMATCALCPPPWGPGLSGSRYPRT